MSSPPFTVTPNPHVIDLEGLLNGPAATISSSSNSVTARLLVDCRCQLGESILYDDRDNSIVFISILDRTFHKLSLNINNNNNKKGNDDDGDDDDNNVVIPNKLQTYKVPKMIGSIGLLENSTDMESGSYLVAWEDGFQLYNLEQNKPLSPMSVGECVNPNGLPDRLNDGRCDPTGKHFICGGTPGKPDPVKVYKCEYDTTMKCLKHVPIVDEIHTTNSICWSLDGTTMYLADSPTLKIHQYDYNLKDGTVSNKREFTDKPVGFADGSVVDAQGYVWNATWRQGQGTAMVDRIHPKTGQIVFTVHLPDETSESSCCCFGGPDLDILFITSAWEHLDPSTEPNAGGLYAVKLPKGMTGRKENRFITEP